MSEIVPLQDVKRANFTMHGVLPLFEYHTDLLNRDDADLINKHVNFKLYFGSHGTDPDNYLATEKAFDDFDPAITTLCFEQAAYSVDAQHKMKTDARESSTSSRMRRQREAILSSRNSVGGNYLSSTNAFLYAQEFCIANGYDTHFVDRDRWESLHWEEAIRQMGDADNDPILHEKRKEFLDAEWQKLDFVDAVIAHTRLGDKATALIDGGAGSPYVVYRWREQHLMREKAVVRKLKDLALAKAIERDEQTTSPSNKHTIALFFGGAHRTGIVSRMMELGLHCDTELLTEKRMGASSIDMPIDGNEAHEFINILLWSELQKVYGDSYNATDVDSPFHPRKLNAICQAVCHTMDKLPTSALSELYESYRSYLDWYNPTNEPEKTTVLSRTLMAERKKRENPKKILDNLISNVAALNGQNLMTSMNELDFAAKESTRRLFGN